MYNRIIFVCLLCSWYAIFPSMRRGELTYAGVMKGNNKMPSQSSSSYPSVFPSLEESQRLLSEKDKKQLFQRIYDPSLKRIVLLSELDACWKILEQEEIRQEHVDSFITKIRMVPTLLVHQKKLCDLYQNQRQVLTCLIVGAAYKASIFPQDKLRQDLYRGVLEVEKDVFKHDLESQQRRKQVAELFIYYMNVEGLRMLLDKKGGDLQVKKCMMWSDQGSRVYEADTTLFMGLMIKCLSERSKSSGFSGLLSRSGFDYTKLEDMAQLLLKNGASPEVALSYCRQYGCISDKCACTVVLHYVSPGKREELVIER